MNTSRLFLVNRQFKTNFMKNDIFKLVSYLFCSEEWINKEEEKRIIISSFLWRKLFNSYKMKIVGWTKLGCYFGFLPYFVYFYILSWIFELFKRCFCKTGALFPFFCSFCGVFENFIPFWAGFDFHSSFRADSESPLRSSDLYGANYVSQQSFA